MQVIQTVEVEIDETKFTEDFLSSFREDFYQFKNIEAHVKHLAQLNARGIDRDFIEGYGPAQDFGIKFTAIDQDEEILAAVAA